MYVDEHYYPFEVHATMTVSNCGGYELQISACGEGARVRLVSDKVHWTTEWAEIEYMDHWCGDSEEAATDTVTRPFIAVDGDPLYLDDFIRTNR